MSTGQASPSLCLLTAGSALPNQSVIRIFKENKRIRQIERTEGSFEFWSLGTALVRTDKTSGGVRGGAGRRGHGGRGTGGRRESLLAFREFYQQQ